MDKTEITSCWFALILIPDWCKKCVNYLPNDSTSFLHVMDGNGCAQSTRILRDPGELKCQTVFNTLWWIYSVNGDMGITRHMPTSAN